MNIKNMKKIVLMKMTHSRNKKERDMAEKELIRRYNNRKTRSDKKNKKARKVWKRNKNGKMVCVKSNGGKRLRSKRTSKNTGKSIWGKQLGRK